MINEKNKELVNNALDAIDWSLVYRVYKFMNKRLCSESIKLPCFKNLYSKKKYNEEDIRNEIECLINYIIENDIYESFYGLWYIRWINGEWEVKEKIYNVGTPYEIGTQEDYEENEYVLGESKLEIKFMPIVITINKKLEESPQKNIDFKFYFQKFLDKAIKEENYEIASKIKEIMNNYEQEKENNQKNR